MHRRRAYVLALTALALLAGGGILQAAEAKPTTIHLSNMHCAGCAKRLANKLYTVAGVVTVKTDVKKKVAFVTPGANKTLSPKAVWQAVLAAKLTPVKLAGPSGTFTEMPKN